MWCVAGGRCGGSSVSPSSAHLLDTMSRRPVIAFFAPVAPYPPPLYGGQIRVDRLLRQLLREFDVALVCETPVAEEELEAGWEGAGDLARIVTAPRRLLAEAELPEWGTIAASTRAAARVAVPGALPALHDVLWSDELVAKARRLFRELPIEGVWACRSWMGEMARAAGARRIHVDVDDLEGRLMLERIARDPFYKRKPLHWLQATHLDRYERRLGDRFAGVSVCKPEDVPRFLSGSRSNVSVVPNGIDLPRTARAATTRSPSILFVGALWYAPNAEALAWFTREVFPRVRAVFAEATLIVAGRGPLAPGLSSHLARPGVELHESPASLDELYARASLSVAPLLTGGGTSIKVLESLAYGVPVVASPVAVRGLGLEAGTHLSVASSPDEFARACAALLSNPGVGDRAAALGRAEVASRFSWDIAGASARAAMRSVLQD